MNFRSFEDLNHYLSLLIPLGMGASGFCYLRKKDNMVLKIFHDYELGDIVHDKEQILQFKNIPNESFIWASNIVTVNGTIVGYLIPYVNERNLYKQNPLITNIDGLIEAIKKVREDIKKISLQGVETYDMLYNILMGRNFHIIDQDEYSYTQRDPSILEKENKQNFDQEIYLYLVDSLFNDIVNDDKQLRELYSDKHEDVLIFIQLLRQRLSELVGKKIIRLRDATEYMDKVKKSPCYQRTR